MNYKKIIKDSVIGYIAFLIILFFFQSWFIYHPRTFDSYEDKLTQINGIIVSDQNLEWVFLPSKQISNKTLVYFHGNAGAAIDRVSKASPWRENGFNVVLAEYPGYGTNDGRPSEEEFYRVGRVIIDKTLKDFPNAHLYIYGESIGSGTATQMATEYDEKALIIESGFSSLVDVAFSKMPFIPVSLLLRDKFDNISKINDINSRLIVIHGDADTVVPFRFGKNLFDGYKGEKQKIVINGAGHNDIYNFLKLDDLINILK